MAGQTLNIPAEIPPELDRWNWGAFFLNWIWGIGNSVFIALLALIPGVNLIVMIVLGAKGSSWAWRNRAWRDAAHFRRVQRNWSIAGFVIWILVIGGFVGSFASIPLMMRTSEPFKLTMQMVTTDSRVAEALGQKVQTNSFFVYGSIHVDAFKEGDASFSFPVKGDKGTGTVVSRGMRSGGVWDMRLMVVHIDASGENIVLANKDNVPIPHGGGALAI